MSGSWAQHLEFPNTVDTITLHLETTMRAKRELEYIADGMTQWKFRRLDDKRLNWLGKERGMKQSTWSGPSTITSQRWLRDEARPGEIDYCVLSLTWAIGSGEQSQDTGAFENDTVEAPAGTRSNASTASDAAVWIGELKAAGVPPNASAPTTSEMCNAYRLRLGVGPDRHRVSEDQIALDEEDSSDFAEETRLRQFSRQDEFDLDDDEFGYYQTEYERLYKQGQIDHYYDLKEVDEQAAKAFKSSLTYWDDETSSGEGLDVEEEEWEDESDQSEEYEDGSDADNDLNGNEL
ncbi:Hypothetical protein D9617_4g001360 [Elsinoe fawcettii]|nr:Hypothetical protein D9617_4g001360 [Elsinoe fawcettii]